MISTFEGPAKPLEFSPRPALSLPTHSRELAQNLLLFPIKETAPLAVKAWPMKEKGFSVRFKYRKSLQNAHTHSNTIIIFLLCT